MNPFKKIDENTYQDEEGILYKPIPNYEDYYVSNLGDIYSTKWGKWKKLKIHLNENGYRRVTLRQQNKTVVRRAARLTALAFILTDNPDLNVIHIDNMSYLHKILLENNTRPLDNKFKMLIISSG